MIDMDSESPDLSSVLLSDDRRPGYGPFDRPVEFEDADRTAWIPQVEQPHLYWDYAPRIGA